MAGMCSRARERGLRSRDRAVINWLALHLHSLQSTDRYRGETQWNWSDDTRVNPALATGRCWSCSLCQRFSVNVSSASSSKSRTLDARNLAYRDSLIQVAWFLASPARPCTWQRPGKYSVPVFGCTHSFPNVARVPRSQTRHDRRKRTFITDEQTSLLKAYVFSFLDKFGTREALNFRTIARVATFNSASWQQRPTAGTWNERTWAKLRTKGFQ